jgi:hypothetical protein
LFGKLARALSAASWVRAVPMTWAPRSDNTLHASAPRPDVHPVTSIVLPVSESPSVTSSAVELNPKPVGPLDLKTEISAMNDSLWIEWNEKQYFNADFDDDLRSRIFHFSENKSEVP